LDKKGIRTVWLWDRDKAFWRAWSPDNRIMEIIDSYGLDTFKTIPAYSGFWVSASGDEVITLCDVNFDVNRLVPFRGTVKYIDLEGGFYGIVDETGKEYLPLNLKDEFKVDGLKVEGIGEIEENATTVYMWGTPINVLKIEKSANDETSTENSTIDLNRGLVAYWSFDNCDARDDSGNGHDGEIHGNPECVEGVVGKALRFDGNDYITIDNVNRLSFENEFTINVLIQPEKTYFNWIVVLTKGITMKSEYDIVYECQNGICKPHVRFTDDEDVNYVYTEDTINAINMNKWNSITWRFKDGLLSIFLNGNLILAKQLPFKKIKNSKEPLEIGRDLPGGTEFFYGILDEIRIYNRALTEDEIRALYEQGKKK
jgi:hypothetical protein